MNTIRRWIIRIDAAVLIAAAVGGLTIASLGYYRDTGPYAFLHNAEVGHAGLVQAYLLAVSLAVVMLVGSRSQDPRPFNLVGALTHLSILPAYLLHWNYLGAAAGNIRLVFIVHATFVIAEVWAAAPHPRREQHATTAVRSAAAR
jgi:hypothetical protein